MNNIMNKFIRLHNANNNSVIVVNVNDISVIDTQEFEGRLCSYVITRNENTPDFWVNETPEKLFKILEPSS